MTNIITISAHGPYINNPYCYNDFVEPDNEFSCLTYLSNKTDKMLEALLKRLKEDNLLDNSVIILYSDHYPYAYDFTEEELAAKEQIDTNHTIRNLPFIIYSNSIKPEKINTLFSDIDIVPTILNFFGIAYNPSNYVGTDIFSKEHKDINIFTDYSWYDGKNYSFETESNSNEFIKITEYVQKVIELNRMMISNNYYGAKKE